MSNVKIKMLSSSIAGFTLGKTYEGWSIQIGIYTFLDDLLMRRSVDVSWYIAQGYIELVSESNPPPELEVGMRVSISNKLFLVMPDVFISSNGGYIFRSTTLINPIEYIYTKPRNPSSALDPNTIGDLLWKRTPPPKKVTMQEVCERFGCEVEITQ